MYLLLAVGSAARGAHSLIAVGLHSLNPLSFGGVLVNVSLGLLHQVDGTK